MHKNSQEILLYSRIYKIQKRYQENLGYIKRYIKQKEIKFKLPSVLHKKNMNALQKWQISQMNLIVISPKLGQNSPVRSIHPASPHLILT